MLKWNVQVTRIFQEMEYNIKDMPNLTRMYTASPEQNFDYIMEKNWFSLRKIHWIMLLISSLLFATGTYLIFTTDAHVHDIQDLNILKYCLKCWITWTFTKYYKYRYFRYCKGDTSHNIIKQCVFDHVKPEIIPLDALRTASVFIFSRSTWTNTHCWMCTSCSIPVISTWTNVVIHNVVGGSHLKTLNII